MPRFVLTIVALAGLAFPAPRAGGAEGDVAALLRKTIDGHGGRERLERVSGFRANGKILSLADGVNGRVRFAVELEGNLRFEIRYPSRREIRILAGTLAWNGDRREQKPSDPDMAASMRLQYHRIAAPFDLLTSSPEDLSFAGVSEEGWPQLRREWGSALRMTYAIDPDTGWIQRVVGVLGPEDDALEFVTESSDFRTIDGVVFPFRTTTIVAGEVAAETILDRVKLEDEFLPGDFLPTGSAGEI